MIPYRLAFDDLPTKIKIVKIWEDRTAFIDYKTKNVFKRKWERPPPPRPAYLDQKKKKKESNLDVFRKKITQAVNIEKKDSIIKNEDNQLTKENESENYENDFEEEPENKSSVNGANTQVNKPQAKLEAIARSTAKSWFDLKDEEEDKQSSNAHQELSTIIDINTKEDDQSLNKARTIKIDKN